MLTRRETSILEEIVSLDGNCMDNNRCSQCPFRSKCLPLFLKPETKPSTQVRLNMALDVMANASLIDSDLSKSDIETDYGWGKK